MLHHIKIGELPTQGIQPRQTVSVGSVVCRDHVQVRRGRDCNIQRLHEQDQSLETHGEAGRRRLFTAKGGYQRVVTPPAAYRALRPEMLSGPLKHRFIVVIETAHQPGVHHIGDTERVELAE